MEDYNTRKQNRIYRYKARSQQAAQNSKSKMEASTGMLSGIPAGQPVLVGHHSEKSHRRLLEKSHNLMGASIREGDKAGYYADKARAAEQNTAISSDDPDALGKLQSKLAGLEEKQEQMKALNKHYKKHSSCKGFPGISDEEAEKMDAAIGSGSPYPHYKLTNNGATIRSTKKRIENLQRLEENPIDGWEFEGGSVEANQEFNRLQIRFNEVPVKQFRERLRHYHGFIWAPSELAWQRQLNNRAVYAAKNAIREFLEQNDEIRDGDNQ